MRKLMAAVALVVVTACGSETGPAPTPLPRTGTSLGPSANGAFVVSGSVSDSAGRALQHATVTVVDGPPAGTTTTTDERGRFTLSQVTGLATIRASKDGYQTQVKRL